MADGLTVQQRQLLTYLREELARTDGICPTYTEMAQALGLRSKSGIGRLIAELEQRGYLRHRRGVPRSLSLITKTCPHCGGSLDGIVTNG